MIHTFYTYGEDGTQTAGTMDYDASAYKTRTYVYTADEELTNYAECTKKGNPNILLYRYLSNETEGNSTVIKLKKDIVAYKVHIDFNDVSVTEEDNLYLLVTVKHKTGSDTYYVEQIKSNISDYVVQTAETQNWYDLNGNPDSKERLNGSEQITAVLVKSQEPISVGNAIKKENCSALDNGAIINSYKVTYGKEDETPDPQKNDVTDIIDHIALSPVTVDNQPDFKSILGDTLQYGLVADRVKLAGHVQTNIATNYYDFNGNINMDMSGEFGGHSYVSHFVTFPAGQTTADGLEDNENGVFHLGKSHTPQGVVVHLTDKNRLQADDPSYVVVVEEPLEAINSTE